VDSAGNVVTSSNPVGGPAAWRVAHVDGTELTGVTCPSTSLCVAVDNAGNVVTSTNPTGGSVAWKVSHVGGPMGLSGVSCADNTSPLCVAVGYGGFIATTTNPAGGTGAWTSTHALGSNFLYGVSCPSTNLCVAVDSSGKVVLGTRQA
jgi:hypothetical protein